MRVAKEVSQSLLSCKEIRSHEWRSALERRVKQDMNASPCLSADMSTNMALFSQAGLLGIRPKGFAVPPERFEADDFYRCAWQIPLAHACT